MSGSVHVRSIQALDEYRTALKRFAADAQAALQAAAQETLRVLAWLDERQRHWQGEVRRAEEVVRQSQGALRRCESSGYRDRDGRYRAPDCSAYIQELHRAEAMLRNANEELHTVQQWRKKVQEVADDYRREARRLEALCSSEVPKATAVLGRKADTLKAYVALHGPSGEGPLGIVGSVGTWTEGDESTAITRGASSIGSAFVDQQFSDSTGRALVSRVFQVGRSLYLRVYDSSKSSELPEHANTGDAGLANLLTEFGEEGQILRIRLQDIITPPSYRGSGIGSHMLDQVEHIGVQYGASEIYGDAPSDEATRAWYLRRGYEFRDEGRVVFKTLRQGE